MRSPLVPALCAEYGALVRPVLERFLAPRQPFDALIADYPSRGGKGMRPALLIAAARLFGAPLEPAVAAAASLEMLHNALLIHDDIQDGSEERRSRPTLHLQHGLPLALAAGDALALRSFQPLLEISGVSGPQLTLRIFEETQLMARESAEGQALELGWQADNEMAVTEADYMVMVLKKTCWLATIYPLRLGAVLSERQDAPLDSLLRFGFFIGTAFQIQDDLLNLIGDQQSYGKELAGDLWEGKRTLMLIHFVEQASAEELERLRGFLALPRGQRQASDVRWLQRRMEFYGAFEYAQRIARGLAGAARYELDRAFGHLPDSRDKHFMEELVIWVLERNL